MIMVGTLQTPNLLSKVWKAALNWWPLVALFGVCVLVAGFYFVENSSGKREWEKCKRELEARGEVLDWLAYIPAAIPQEQNIFRAPNMHSWFVRGASGNLGSRLSPGFSRQNQGVPHPVVVARVTVVSNLAESAASDLLLDYTRPMLKSLKNIGTREVDTGPKEAVIPLIVMDEVPLRDAITNLAKAANLQCAFNPAVLHNGAKQTPEPNVSLRWENVTARHALVSMLNNYGLLLRVDPGGRKAQIIPARPGKTQVFADSAVQGALAQALQQTVAPLTTNHNPVGLKAPQGFTLVAGHLDSVEPLRILVRSEDVPDSAEIAAFFPPDALKPLLPENATLRSERTRDATNVFQVLMNSVPCYSADEYLEWSDQFEPDFDLIREALKRPFARIDGDYSQPVGIPIPNFVSIRMLSQTLAQRAQSCLLLGRREQALRELTLLHELGRLLDAKPSGHPMTLVAAMIKVAVTGIYVATVADGLRMHAWQEPEVAALQAELESISLTPSVLEAFRQERAALCRTLEMTPPADLQRLWSGGANPSLRQKLTQPSFWVLRNVPRGCIYQNMVVIASEGQKLLDCFEPQRQVIHAQRIDTLGREQSESMSRFSPRTFIASMVTANFRKAWQTVGLTQTRVNEAVLACALERYRLANGHFPFSLEELNPGFIQRIPRDLMTVGSLHYALKENGRFTLYSVGWNERDDGGTVAKNSGGQPDTEHGDWVWTSEEDFRF